MKILLKNLSSKLLHAVFILLLFTVFITVSLINIDTISVQTIAAEVDEEDLPYCKCDEEGELKCEDDDELEYAEEMECECTEEGELYCSGGEPDPQFVLGQKLFNGHCAPCHGINGDAEAWGSSFIYPRARDFTSGMFKFRSTGSGEPPTDEDLIFIIKNGNPGTAMPKHGDRFSEEEMTAIIEYIKLFNEETFEMEPDVFEIGDPPEPTPELIAAGREVFMNAKCFECHGMHGRGDGIKGWQDNFKDDWGYRIWPANLQHPWELRNGARTQDLWRSISTGLDGTPMASYSDAYSVDERWALSTYLKSIQWEQDLEQPLQISLVDKTPTDTYDPVWDSVDYMDITMGGKKLFGFGVVPRVTNARLRGVYNKSEFALMVEWIDKKPNKADDNKPPDSLAVYIPIYSAVDAISNINLWNWRSSDDQTYEMAGKTDAQMKKQKNNDIKAISSYKDGIYRVILTRNMKTSDSSDIKFEPGKTIKVKIRARDGEFHEQGKVGGVSGQVSMEFKK